MSRLLSCFTVFQLRTLGWVWGFFPAYFTDRRLEGKELETGRVLPFRRQLRHGGAGVDAGSWAGVAPDATGKALALCAPLLACRDNLGWTAEPPSQVTVLDVSQELGLCVTCRDGAPPQQGGRESQEDGGKLQAKPLAAGPGRGPRW